jgi:hypothetical protein
MLYLKKPLPCYYLVYVEVEAPFRNKGLGNLILTAYRDFLLQKCAVGILDNIIPEDDPTYDIYTKLEWRPVQSITGAEANGDGVYMAFVPPALETRDIKDRLLKLVHHIKRKRATIDMRDNEHMVKRTIDEFKDLYAALCTYFAGVQPAPERVSLERFMFTRFTTKLLGFGRRIADLLGYTGGESLNQIMLDPAVRDLPIQSYAPKAIASGSLFISGDRELWLALPEAIKQSPARGIEALPNYRRPKLMRWLKKMNRSHEDPVTIGDLLDLGFDPSRLKEITLAGERFIFERMQARMLPELQRRVELLSASAQNCDGVRVRNAPLNVNVPLLIIADRGNVYVLRRKIDAIHMEEALEELRVNPELAELNAELGLEKMITLSVRRGREWLKKTASVTEYGQEIEHTSWFVSWDLKINRPRLCIDMSGTSLETVWMA